MFEKLFPATFDLKTLNGKNGFMLSGVVSGDESGYSLNTAGDVNGDGIDDIIIGMTNAQGASYVVFGRANGFPANFALQNLNGTNGFTVHWLHAGDRLGISVDTAGDINGDGKADILLGADGVNNNAGATYVIFGQTNFPAQFNLATLNGSNGFSILGLNAGEQLGRSVSRVGDVNADGKADIVLGAWTYNNNQGACYVIFGQSSFPASFDLRTLNGVNGFTVYGLNLGNLGIVNTAGDMNHDGKADLVLGAPNYVVSGPGAVYVIFGQSSFPASFDLRSLNGINGFAVPGLNTGSFLGYSVSTAGDINDDKKDDLILGAYGVNNRGATYVIFGQTNFPAQFNLATLNGNNGFIVPGLNVGDNLGIVSTAGDINGDGYVDIALGAPAANSNRGNCYVILGQPSFPASFDLRILNGTNGFAVPGLNAGDVLGIVGSAGDINADGINDVAFGAWGALNGAGASYIIFGRANPIPPPMPIPNPTPAPVIHHPPVVLNSPPSQRVEVNQPFEFTFEANQIFNSTDGDLLTFAAQSNDGSPLPEWVYFHVQDVNHLTFTGRPLTVGDTDLALLAKNPWNQSAQANFSLSTTAPTSSGIADYWKYLIGAGAGALGFGALIGLGYGFYKECCEVKPINPQKSNEKTPLRFSLNSGDPQE